MMVIGGKMMVDRKWASTDQEVLPGAGQGSHHLSLPPPPISKRESWEVSCILPFFILMHTCSAQSSHNLSLKSTISGICLGGGTKTDLLETFQRAFGGLPPFGKICWKKFPLFFSHKSTKRRKNLQKTIKSQNQNYGQEGHLEHQKGFFFAEQWAGNKYLFPGRVSRWNFWSFWGWMEFETVWPEHKRDIYWFLGEWVFYTAHPILINGHPRTLNIGSGWDVSWQKKQ